MAEIFISYSRLDREFVDQLIEELERRGFDIWVDRKDISGGADWRAAISQAIRSCRAFLVVLSHNSADSKKVVQELSLADQHERQIIPLMHDTCDIPADMDLQLATLQRIDFVENSFEEAVNQLESALTGKSHTKAPTKTGSEKNQDRARRATPPPSAREQNVPLPDSPPVQQPSLATMLPGVWQIQIAHPMSGMMGQLTVELFPNGMFQGQLLAPTGQTAVQGMWQITPLNQLVMQGQQSNGFQTIPYGVVLQFNSVAPNHLTGFSGAGEQVACQKIR
jgi:hypothetical protein